MCLCNGTGSVGIVEDWGIQYHACPDSNCKHDLTESQKRYEDWKNKMFKQMVCDALAKF